MNYSELWHRLTTLYDENEAKAIVRWILEERFSLSATDIYCGKVELLSAPELQQVSDIMQRLERAEPVQYVLGTAYFCGRPFHVEPGVLIPRPETEELCRRVVQDNAAPAPTPRKVLDIGTGSGCIAITLALDLPDAEVTAWDVSDAALHIARGNASALAAQVSFEKRDALNPPPDRECWDIIVSNPPYIDKAAERGTMARNVLDYEPHLALFAPEGEPDLFYRRISDYALLSLKHGSQLFFELNPLTARTVAGYLNQAGFQKTAVWQDQFGKDRLLKATKI